MTEEQIIRLGLEAHLLNYVDNETPRRYFVCGNADLEDVKDFARLVSEEQANEIKRLREALRQIAKCDLQAWALGALDKNSDDQRQALERIAQYDMRKIAIDALGEGKE